MSLDDAFADATAADATLVSCSRKCGRATFQASGVCPTCRHEDAEAARPKVKGKAAPVAPRADAEFWENDR